MRNLPLVISGWKQLSQILGRHPDTLKDWDSYICRLPRRYTRQNKPTNPHKRGIPWVTTFTAALSWAQNVGSQLAGGHKLLPTEPTAVAVRRPLK